jgi:hypothetical protein
MITRPLQEGHGLRRPFGSGFERSEDFEDYLLLTMQALMRAIPDASKGELPDPELFPPREREPVPSKKQRKAPLGHHHDERRE